MCRIYNVKHAECKHPSKILDPCDEQWVKINLTSCATEQVVFNDTAPKCLNCDYADTYGLDRGKYCASNNNNDTDHNGSDDDDDDNSENMSSNNDDNDDDDDDDNDYSNNFNPREKYLHLQTTENEYFQHVHNRIQQYRHRHKRMSLAKHNRNRDARYSCSWNDDNDRDERKQTPNSNYSQQPPPPPYSSLSSSSYYTANTTPASSSCSSSAYYTANENIRPRNSYSPSRPQKSILKHGTNNDDDKYNNGQRSVHWPDEDAMPWIVGLFWWIWEYYVVPYIPVDAR